MADTSKPAVAHGFIKAKSSTPAAQDFPVDAGLADVCLPLPSQVGGKYLADPKTIKPCIERGHLIKLCIGQSNEGLNIVDTAGNAYYGGVKFVQHKHLLKELKYVLQDKDGATIAVCVEDAKKGINGNAFKIYGKVPLASKGETLKDGDQELHPWFRVVHDHPGFLSVDLWDGVEFKPFLRGYPDRDFLVGLAIKSADNKFDFGYMVKGRIGELRGWGLTIPPGVDPAMMICIAACMDKLFVNGKFSASGETLATANTHSSSSSGKNGTSSSAQSNGAPTNGVNHEPVSGQVKAKDGKPAAHDFPPDTQLARTVLPLPPHVDGKYLVTDSELKPVQMPGYLIKICMDHALDFLARNGEAGFADTHGKSYAGGVKFVEQKKLLQDRRFLLNDKEENTIALIMPDSNSVGSVLTIYGKRPLTKKYDSSCVVRQSGVEFYPWFRAAGDHPVFVPVDCFDGKKYKPFLRGFKDKKENAVGLVFKTADLAFSFGYMLRKKSKKDKAAAWDITIAPGVDPTMMLCIAACVNSFFSAK